MKRTVYKPKIVEGRINGTGWPVDGCTLALSLWDHDDHGCCHLCGWPDEAGQAVMETMFITETAAGMCLYDTLEEFAGHWEEWEPEGSFCIPLDKVEEIRVIQEETKECINRMGRQDDPCQKEEAYDGISGRPEREGRAI